MVVSALMAIGLVMVASASASLDRSPFAVPLLRAAWGRQAIFALAGLAAMTVTSRAAVYVLRSPSLRRRFAQVLFALALGALLAALVPGLAHARRGSHRWLGLSLGGMDLTFQPSEFAKLAMVALVASLLTQRAKPAPTGSSLPGRRTRGEEQEVDPRSLRHGFLRAALPIGACVLLVGEEDFGTAVLLSCVGAAMLFVAGCRLRHLAALGGLGACALAALLYTAPYRVERLTAYADLWADPQGKGYQPIQSLAAIASGGWLGAGLGSGVQKYGYLPESHTDFIFAVICEEMGLLGAGLVMALFAVFIWLGVRIMLAAPSRFERLLAFGLTLTIGLQAIMNIAVVTVVTPTTGISLPLVSAGGSGLFTFCLMAGALGAVALRGCADSESEVPFVIGDCSRRTAGSTR